MAVMIYKLSGAQSLVSHDDSFTNPIMWEVTPTGGTFEKVFYLRNDTAGTYATDIKVSAADSAGADESDWYKFSSFSFAPDAGGSPGEYVAELSVPELTSTGEYPFWIKIEVPEAIETGPKTDISVKVNAIIHNEV